MKITSEMCPLRLASRMGLDHGEREAKAMRTLLLDSGYADTDDIPLPLWFEWVCDAYDSVHGLIS